MLLFAGDVGSPIIYQMALFGNFGVSRIHLLTGVLSCVLTGSLSRARGRLNISG